MDKKEINKLKQWWNNCPDKRVVCIKNIFLVLLVFHCLYRLGYAIGVFLSNIGF